MLGQNTRIFSTMCRWEGGARSLRGGGGGAGRARSQEIWPWGGEIPRDFAAGGGGGEITGGRNPWDTGKVYILLTVMKSYIFTV